MRKKKSALLYSIISLMLCLSMLVGTTFAWFTDSVKTGINTIASGVLDVELYHSNTAVTDELVDANTNLFKDLNGNDILWEPGVVSYENLRITNAGDLALCYEATLNTANENYVQDPSGAQYGLSQILKIGFVEGGITATDRDGVVNSVQAGSWTTLSNFLQRGSLLPEGAGESEHTWGVVVYWEPGDSDNYWNLNNGKQLNEGDVLSIDLGIKLIATQETSESDSFNNGYDSNAKAEFFPGFQGGAAGAVVTVDDQGQTTEAVAMQGGDVSAAVPAGVQVADGVEALQLTVTNKDTSMANIHLSANEEMRPLDVHIEGVAAGNTVPMLVTLKQYMSTGINTGALRLYHVENGTTVPMTQVANPVNHNEFSYNPATGDVTLALASFSEVAVVADVNNPWDGETVNTLWYNASATELTIYNADQLAGFAAIVDGKAEGIAQDSFSDKTVKLGNNITLSDKLFDPIGWGYVNAAHNRDGVAGKVFQGTFDGNGKVIYDLYQSGWDLEDPNQDGVQDADYTYTNCGFGLFAAASNAHFKNLTINGAYVRVECVEAGVLVGLSQNNCTYNNIKIHNAKIANYQRPAGGLIGEVSGTGTTKITNVTITSDVVVGSLWGDFDAPCGGVIGARWDDVGANPQIVMTDVNVGARMDVYSDVTAAYQWHAYRRAGMLIGNTDVPAADGRNAKTAEAPFLTCTNVKVHYGDWAVYHYCLFTNSNNPGKNYPWVRVEAGENNPAYSNPRYGHPTDANGNAVTNESHKHKDGDTCNMEIRFNQLYGGGQGVYGQPKHEGVEVINYRYSITYVNDYQVLAIKYVTETGEVTTAHPGAQDLVEKWATENIKDYAWEFGGWMNAGSTKLTSIDANNTENVVLYPYFNKPYTASFVDPNGNILAWCLFFEDEPDELGAAKAEAEKLMPYPSGEFELDYWMVDINGGVKYENADFSEFTQDVTIYPVFKYNGDVQLIPVDDNNDGATDYYQVGGFGSKGQITLVEIPGEVNGVKVTEINADAFSGYDDLHSVRIPGSITAINYQSFTADNPNQWGTQRDTVTLYYDGDPAVWKAAMDDYNNRVFNDDSLLKSGWDNCMGSGSRVFFLTDGKVNVDAGYWELLNNKDWYYHDHAYTPEEMLKCNNPGPDKHYGYKDGWFSDPEIESDKYTNYAGNCDCGCGVRPDKKYWD